MVYSDIVTGADRVRRVITVVDVSLDQISKATKPTDYDGLINHFTEVKVIPNCLFSLHLSFNRKLFASVAVIA